MYKIVIYISLAIYILCVIVVMCFRIKEMRRRQQRFTAVRTLCDPPPSYIDIMNSDIPPPTYADIPPPTYDNI